MICKNCGKKLPDDSRFCNYCGAVLDAPEEDDEEQRKLEALIAAGEGTQGGEEKAELAQTPGDEDKEPGKGDKKEKKKLSKWQVLAIICLIVFAIGFLFGDRSDDEEEEAAEPVDVEVGAASDPADESDDIVYSEDGTAREETVVRKYDNYTETFVYSYGEDGELTGYTYRWEDEGSVSVTVYDENGNRVSVDFQGEDSSYTTTYEYELDDDGEIIWMSYETFGTDSDGADYLEGAEYVYEDGMPVSWSSDDMTENTAYYYYLYNESYDYWGVYVISQEVDVDGYTLLGEITYNEDGTVEAVVEDGYEWVMHGDGIWPEKSE